MTMQNSDYEGINPLGSPPADWDDLDWESGFLPAPKAAKPNHHRFDVGQLFWKFVASGSRETSPQILAVLATDERCQIRRRCAENPSTAPDTLAILADDPVFSVRAAVARNKHTPMYLLRRLSQDENVDVRFAIAANAEMPDAILLSLFLDPDPYVADRASQTLAA
jgi:hypothetical protein